MTEYERTVLDHYQLPSAFPTEWPTEKDQSDASDDDEAVAAKEEKSKTTRRKSKYSALEHVSSYRRSFVPGAQKLDGVESLVRKDEPDPLGAGDSVLRILRSQGLPVQDDIKLRNRFLLSSTTFSPSQYLEQVHRKDSTEQLLRGLDVLTRSIDQKSASLKLLVESNFERFVKAKATIDSVYTEMKTRGAEPKTERRRSRHLSRSSYRNSSISAAPGLGGFLAGDKQKNALTKESEYGTLGIKLSLETVAHQAQDIWAPVFAGAEKEQTLKIVADALERHNDAYQTPGLIGDAIKRKDYESIVDEYAKAKRIADEANQLSEELVSKRITPNDRQVQQIVVAGRMWFDVQARIEAFKREIWRRLAVIPYNSGESENNVPSSRDQHMELISILLELGVEDNPISVWLFTRHDHLKEKINATSERSRAEMEVLRRRLANAKEPTLSAMGSHLQSLSRQGLEIKATIKDSAKVIEMWERGVSFISGMMSSEGILGEVLEFWQTVRGFVDGKTQRTLPVGMDGESRKHHRLSQQGVMDLQKGTAELVDLIRQEIASFFLDAPVEDISVLYTPTTPTGQPRSPGLPPTSFRDPRFAFNESSNLPAYPRTGEQWERFAFWPPWANSLSSVDYLSRILTMVGTGASDMAGVSAVGKGDNGEALERIRSMVSGARERSVTAICGAWIRDSENIKVLEDWRRAAEKKDITRMPANFTTFEHTILLGLQKILYIPDAQNKSASEDVVLPPQAKILQMVRSQFVTTLYKALSGMVENAERQTPDNEDEFAENKSILRAPAKKGPVIGASLDMVDSSDRNVRMLLTLSNLTALRTDVVPKLESMFENAFSVKLTDESKTIRDVLAQIDAKLFQSYTKPALEKMQAIIQRGVSAPDWEPRIGDKPDAARPYVHEVLLGLVVIHSQVSTTAPPLTAQVLSYLLEELTISMSTAFAKRDHYTLSAIMQATLDLEFLAQTLMQYTSEKQATLTSEIYAMLDEKTDNEARVRLQGELNELKATLKGLRDKTRWEFGAFRRERKRGMTTQQRQEAH